MFSFSFSFLNLFSMGETAPPLAVSDTCGQKAPAGEDDERRFAWTRKCSALCVVCVKKKKHTKTPPKMTQNVLFFPLNHNKCLSMDNSGKKDRGWRRKCLPPWQVNIWTTSTPGRIWTRKARGLRRSESNNLRFILAPSLFVCMFVCMFVYFFHWLWTTSLFGFIIILLCGFNSHCCFTCCVGCCCQTFF